MGEGQVDVCVFTLTVRLAFQLSFPLNELLLPFPSRVAGVSVLCFSVPLAPNIRNLQTSEANILGWHHSKASTLRGSISTF